MRSQSKRPQNVTNVLSYRLKLTRLIVRNGHATAVANDVHTSSVLSTSSVKKRKSLLSNLEKNRRQNNKIKLTRNVVDTSLTNRKTPPSKLSLKMPSKKACSAPTDDQVEGIEWDSHVCIFWFMFIFCAHMLYCYCEQVYFTVLFYKRV